MASTSQPGAQPLKKSSTIGSPLTMNRKLVTTVSTKAITWFLVSPEIAVLIAYAKIVLFDALIASDLPDDPYMEKLLLDYMPTPIRVGHADAVRAHRLRREIIATVLANDAVNRNGPATISRMRGETGARASQIARAFVAASEIFDLPAVRAEINALDNEVDAAVQTEMHLAVTDAGAAQTLNLLERGGGRDTGALIGDYKPGVAEIAARLTETLSDFSRERLEARRTLFAGGGASPELAERVATLEVMGGAIDVVDAASSRGRGVAEVADTYFAVGARFGLDWLRSAARDLEIADHWERVALGRMVGDLRAQQSRIAAAALELSEGASGADCVAAWADAHSEETARADALLADLRSGGALTVAKLAVASSQFRAIAE